MKNIFKAIGYGLSLPFVGLAALFNVASCRRLAKKYTKRPTEVFLEDRLKRVYKAFKKYLYFKKVKYAVEGIENIHLRQHLFIPNHKSTVDPMVVFCALYDAAKIGETTIIAKDELKQTRAVRYVMTLLDGIFIKRDDGRSIWECYQKEMELIKKGRSVIVFPEGTRVAGDTIGEFKSGALKVAYQNFLPIAPVVIYGSDKETMKKNKDFKKTVSVSFLKVIQPNNYINIQADQLMASIQSDITNKYNELKAKPLVIEKKK